jgi:hypothetical protein
MNPTTSSAGPLRARKHAKTHADTETQHRLWLDRIIALVGTGKTPPQALDALKAEVQTWVSEIPQRKAERLAAWQAFLRRIPR